MPTFEITAPDGTRYQVEGPEGASEQDALAQVQQYHSSANRRVAEDFGALPKPASQSIGESVAAGDNPYAGPQKDYPPIGPAGPEMLGAAAKGAAGGLVGGATAPLWAPSLARTLAGTAGSAGVLYAISRSEDAPEWLKHTADYLALHLQLAAGGKK